MSIEQKINKDLILREKLALQRTSLANQTTFLSFLRTSMYFLVAGLSIGNLLKVHATLYYEVSFYLVSGFLFIYGIINYYRHHLKIQQSQKHIGDYKTEYLNE